MLRVFVVALLIQLGFASSALAAEAKGPLKVLPENPRYFTDGSGKAVYLTGSHTWNDLVDMSRPEPHPNPALDFDRFLDFLASHNHNCVRLWSWQTSGFFDPKGPITHRPTILPFLRTGPGDALDGSPRFDLTKFNQAYFDNMHKRVKSARDRGVYVIVMMFQGFRGNGHGDSWKGHLFNAANNINSVDGDPARAGKGNECDTLSIPAVTAVQEAYVRKVVDTVNDLDNVLYEIVNEDTGSDANTAWQYHMIRFIKDYESHKPKQHPVGMTVPYPKGDNKRLFDSPADWISPNEQNGYQSDPPAADGRKVVLNDTDHSFYYVNLQKVGLPAQQAWVWKNFTRGNQMLFMDPYIDPAPWGTQPDRNKPKAGGPDPYWDVIRKNMGYTRAYADRMNLVAMTPQSALASSGYCLASPKAKVPEYLVYIPQGPSVTLDLAGVTGGFSVEWFNPSTGKSVPAEPVVGGAKIDLSSPFPGDAVLYLKHK